MYFFDKIEKKIAYLKVNFHPINKKEYYYNK